ncbi:MAG TPA: TIGR03013 family XrtA/PEP-CTERM system glycosyltransferase [Verrucomicrobiae bacterium]|jgi:sugar transferase (PEP-CTERM system associated)|nr:TIGR03013 family XrtA/PEP-CTERM system glycosyltransferase [Verrucomicrobiae bacterium]
MLRVFRHYIPHLPLILFFGDLVVLVAAFHVPMLTGTWIAEGALIPKLLLVVLLVSFTLNLGGLYDVRLATGRRELLARMLTCQTVAGLLVAAVAFALPSLRLGRAAFLQIGAAATLGLIAWRGAWIGPFTDRRIRIRVLVLGTGAIGKVIAGLVETGARPFSIVGFLDDNPNAPETVPEPYALLGKIQDLPALVEETRPDLIVVAQMNRRGNFPAKALIDCRMRGIQVEDWPTFYEKETGKILVTDLRPSWLIFSDGFVKTPRTEIVKRLVDVALSLVGLMLALPVMAVVAAAIKMESRGPALFRQPRLGQNGRVFILNKFRSMREDAEKETGPVWAQQQDPRVTRVGAFLRKTRLDELPQLFNVLVGDMSFIGPRPERPEFVYELQKQIPFYMERLSVKPGITGWAQVRYRYGASVEDALEKLQYDLYYIKNLSLFLDLLILINTIQVVLFARGR